MNNYSKYNPASPTVQVRLKTSTDVERSQVHLSIDALTVRVTIHPDDIPSMDEETLQGLTGYLTDHILKTGSLRIP